MDVLQFSSGVVRSLAGRNRVVLVGADDMNRNSKVSRSWDGALAYVAVPCAL